MRLAVNSARGSSSGQIEFSEAHVLRPNRAPVRLLAVADRDGCWNAMIVGAGFAQAHPCSSEIDAQHQARRLFWRAFPTHICNAGCSAARRPASGGNDQTLPRDSRPVVLFHLGHFRSLARDRREVLSGGLPSRRGTNPAHLRNSTGGATGRRMYRRVSRRAALLLWGFCSAALASAVAIAFAMSASA